MTPDEIDALEAGPELDELVALKVMGWTKIKCPPKHGDHYALWVDEGGVSYCGVQGFSMYIDSAWQVVEKLKLRVWPTKQGRWFVSQHEFDEGYGDEYWFGGREFLENVKDGTFGYAVCETAPLAICRAALKSAIGG